MPSFLHPPLSKYLCSVALPIAHLETHDCFLVLCVGWLRCCLVLCCVCVVMCCVVQCPSETLLTVLTTLIVLGSLGVSMVVSDLGVILSIVGATGSTTISYILPGLIFLKLHGHENWTLKHYGAAIVLGIGCVVIPSCLTFIFI